MLLIKKKLFTELYSLSKTNLCVNNAEKLETNVILELTFMKKAIIYKSFSIINEKVIKTNLTS